MIVPVRILSCGIHSSTCNLYVWEHVLCTLAPVAYLFVTWFVHDVSVVLHQLLNRS